MNKEVVRVFVMAKVLERMASAWFFGTYILFLQGIGISLWEASVLNTVFMVTSAILDPFTGNWGDRIGQKKIYIAGLLLWALGNLTYGLAATFLICVVAEIISALGKAFISEALESWLRNNSSDEETHKAMAKSKSWGELSTIPTALLGGIIGARIGLSWPWFLAGITTILITVLVAWKLRKFPEKVVDRPEEKMDLGLWKIAKEAWAEPVLRRSFVAVALVFACYQPFNMFWPVVFKEASGQTEWLGGLWIGIAFTGVIGGAIAKSLKINARTMALIIASTGAPMLLPDIPGNWMVMIVVPFLAHEVGRSAWGPMLWTYTNRRIDSQVRTSVNSLRSSAGTLGAALGLIVSGGMTKWFSPTEVWAISGAMLLLIATWVWRWNHD